MSLFWGKKQIVVPNGIVIMSSIWMKYTNVFSIYEILFEYVLLPYLPTPSYIRKKGAVCICHATIFNPSGQQPRLTIVFWRTSMDRI